jgi:uncharacterized protein (DUF952 family)
MSNCIYRVVSLEDWNQAQGQGLVPLGATDKRDGFVHMSTEQTLIETANLYFKPADKPVVLEVVVAKVEADLKWEPAASRGGALFPHLYAEGIPLTAIQATVELEHSEENGFSFGQKKELT